MRLDQNYLKYVQQDDNRKSWRQWVKSIHDVSYGNICKSNDGAKNDEHNRIVLPLVQTLWPIEEDRF